MQQMSLGPGIEPAMAASRTEGLHMWVIEDGGKAAHCKRLKVGDELININGSALYGSRQEALILIKGSYRILKLTVRSHYNSSRTTMQRLEGL
ncbi:hypothetical protein CCH79_00015874 [Gambusia affinis]|uniref:PDZ domain-containing protein n=1 Tax=Gambusia affinis TaxID=33528 RepID=A0A315V958_GAMAF|nr:hypothetical protein CCH79_00015874 [Gambusia affinis]